MSKKLTPAQFQLAINQAKKLVIERTGAKPHKAQFAIEAEKPYDMLDLVMLIVFTAAFFISSIHILIHMDKLASNSYDIVLDEQRENVRVADSEIFEAGITINPQFYISSHQIAYIFLAEGSIILFLIMFGQTPKSDFRKYVYLIIAILSIVFVLVANIQSNVGTLESIIVPIITIGLGFRIEKIFERYINNRKEVDRKYRKALEQYELATANPENSNLFMPYLEQSLKSKILSLKGYSDLPEDQINTIVKDTIKDNYIPLDNPLS